METFNFFDVPEKWSLYDQEQYAQMLLFYKTELQEFYEKVALNGEWTPPWLDLYRNNLVALELLAFVLDRGLCNQFILYREKDNNDPEHYNVSTEP